MKADLLAFRARLAESLRVEVETSLRAQIETSLRSVISDPAVVPWLTAFIVGKLCEHLPENVALMMTLIREHLAGLRIPTRAEIDRPETEARAAEMLHLGASVVAKRLGCNRSTVYRRAQKHRSRNAA